MRSIKIFSMLVVTLLLCILTSCGTFGGFDDDNAIVKANSVSTVMSSTSMTSAEYKFKCSKINGVELRILQYQIIQYLISILQYQKEDLKLS